MLTTLSFDEIQAINAGIDDRDGWDFSRMRESFSPAPWRYEERLDALLDRHTVLLDQGTGGGERLLEMAGRVRRATGIDLDNAMIEAWLLFTSDPAAE